MQRAYQGPFFMSSYKRPSTGTGCQQDVGHEGVPLNVLSLPS
jgi:hypothetical protein